MRRFVSTLVRIGGLTMAGLLLAVPVLSGPASAQSGAVTTTISGTCLDATTREPIVAACLRILPQDLEVRTDELGRFEFQDVELGNVLVAIHCVGYRDSRQRLTVTADVPEVEVLLEPQPIPMEAVEVVAEIGTSREQTPVLLSREELRKRLGNTVAETLANEPGLAEQTMGPAPARPIARGLGGNRLLVLEDGGNPGDLSATAPDHAVVVDPLGAKSIEVIRGPLAFQYGSSVLGGVVNVRRHVIPQYVPERVRGGMRVHASSIDSGASTHLHFTGPVGNFAYSVEGIGRSANDLRTPVGRLNNTEIDTWSLTGAASYVAPQGIVGFSASRYESDYGIPGGFIGGHRDGVTVELERSRYEGFARYETGHHGIAAFEARGSSSRYFHRELESGGQCGVSFGLLTYDADVGVEFEFDRISGSLGVVGEHRDFAAGCFSFITPTTESTVGGFLVQEAELGRLTLQAAARFDARIIRPDHADTNKAGVIRDRSFSGGSGAVGAGWQLSRGLQSRVQVSRSFRPPAIEELFAEGPHLAAYSYEIGNADLGSERGLGFEASLEWQSPRFDAKGTAFRNEIDDFILPLDSGELEFGQGELGFLPRFIYDGRDALMTGAEFEAAWHATSRFTLDGSASFVTAKFRDNDEHLPRIPPLSGRLRANYRTMDWSFGVTARGAARQDELGVFEDATAAFATFDAALEWRPESSTRWMKSVTVRGTNLADVTYRNHLSRIKSIMPEAGRSVSVIYEVEY